MIFRVGQKVRLYADGRLECAFSVLAFRPAVEKKTDISIFTAMLAPSGRKLETVMTRVRSPGFEDQNPIRTGAPT